MLLVTILKQIYNENDKASKNKYKIYSLRRKRTSRNAMLEPRVVMKDIRM